MPSSAPRKGVSTHLLLSLCLQLRQALLLLQLLLQLEGLLLALLLLLQQPQDVLLVLVQCLHGGQQVTSDGLSHSALRGRALCLPYMKCPSIGYLRFPEVLMKL